MDGNSPLTKENLCVAYMLANQTSFQTSDLLAYFQCHMSTRDPIVLSPGITTPRWHDLIIETAGNHSTSAWSLRQAEDVIAVCRVAGLTMREFIKSTIKDKRLLERYLNLLGNDEDPNYYPPLADWHSSWKGDSVSAWGSLRRLLVTYVRYLGQWISEYPGACPGLGPNTDSSQAGEVELVDWVNCLFVGKKFRPFFQFVTTGRLTEFTQAFEKLEVYPYLMEPKSPGHYLRAPKPAKVEVPTAAKVTLEPSQMDWLDLLKVYLANGFFLPGQTREEQERTICSALDDPEVNAALKTKFPWLYREERVILSSLAKRSPGFWAELVVAFYEYAEAKLLNRDARLFPLTPQKLRQLFETVARTALFNPNVEQLLIYDPLMSLADTQAIWRVEAQKLLTNVNLLEWSGAGTDSFWAQRQMTPEIADRLFNQVMTKVNSGQDLKVREALLETCSKLETCILAKLTTLPETLFTVPTVKPISMSLPEQPTAPRWAAAQFLTEIGVHNEQLAAELGKFDSRPDRLKMLSVEQVVEFVGKYGCGPFDATLVAQELKDRNMLK